MLGCRVAKTDTYVPSLNFLPQGTPHFSIIAFNHPLVVFLFVLGLDFGSNSPNSSAVVFRVRLLYRSCHFLPVSLCKSRQRPIQDMPSLSELGPPATPELLLRRHPRSSSKPATDTWTAPELGQRYRWGSGELSILLRVGSRSMVGGGCIEPSTYQCESLCSQVDAGGLGCASGLHKDQDGRTLDVGPGWGINFS